jgi:proteasome lid subunit RPN8/RPN11
MDHIDRLKYDAESLIKKNVLLRRLTLDKFMPLVKKNFIVASEQIDDENIFLLNYRFSILAKTLLSIHKLSEEDQSWVKHSLEEAFSRCLSSKQRILESHLKMKEVSRSSSIIREVVPENKPEEVKLDEKVEQSHQIDHETVIPKLYSHLNSVQSLRRSTSQVDGISGNSNFASHSGSGSSLYPFFGSGGKTLCVPASLCGIFAQVCDSNNRIPPRGIETCGVLLGRLQGQKLLVTTLVIPPQKGVADSCEMLDEECIVSLALEKGLLQFGWIHSHPSQDSFLSSMDQHTQCSYQTMLPESIAFVYAPQDRNGRIFAGFSLSDAGLNLVMHCKLDGFHPHDMDNDDIYNVKDQSIFFDTALPLEVVNLLKS